MVENEYNIKITMDDAVKALIMSLEKYDSSCSYIYAGTTEGNDVEIYYKGHKVINGAMLKLHGVGFQFEEKIVSWKNRILGVNDGEAY